MTGDDAARLIYYGLLLAVIGGAILFEISGRGSRALRQLVLWVVIFAGAYAAGRVWTDRTTPRQQVLEGGRIEVPLSPDGHFHLTAEVNGTPLRMIVDTGASSIALSRPDAQRVGIDPDRLAYRGTAMTANGQVRTAGVTLDTLSIGPITDHRVPAMVIDGDLSGSLLGMSYLRRFARVGFEGDLLVLER